MKNLLFLLSFLLCLSCKQHVRDTFYNHAVVQDNSDLFSNVEEKKLSEKIINYEKLTTNQICIITIDSVPNNRAILSHATNLANQLDIGLRAKDNGLLILISKFDRQVAIATGVGTEKSVTDIVASAIIEKTIVPNFKDQQYFEGVSVGLDSIFMKWQ
ncbi:TPM domain-containing protein [Lacinutrix chionoecetis]